MSENMAPLAEQVLEIRVNRSWESVAEYIFRSWTGPRRINGVEYSGPVFVLGTNLLYSCSGHTST